MILPFGRRELELGGPYLGSLREATGLRGDVEGLRARMEEDGYVLLRGLHDAAKVRAARELVLRKLAENGQLDPARPADEAVVAPGAAGGRGSFLGGQKTVTHAPEFLALVEAPELLAFFAAFLGGATTRFAGTRAPAATYDYKWLRVVAPGGFTGAHYDIVYMGRGTDRVFTLWTPLGDVPFALGPLAVWEGSHRQARLRETYGRMDVDRDHVDGWFSNDPVELVDRYGGRWLTAEFEAGDALLFGMYTMHASLTNTTGCYRISCDTRYQRADEPVDERWVGEDPKAHYAWWRGEMVSMEEARRRWGV